MNMVTENLSIVIIAKDFNISILKPTWLMKNKIFREQELQGNIVFTPPAVQIPTDNFQFMVLPDRLQMSMPREYSNAEEDISRIIGGIVKNLPHTPYTAMGLNFNYLSAPDNESKFSDWNREYFASPISEKIESPKNEKARFGSYLSFDVLGTRLKIDIKPLKASANIEKLYNFWHIDQDLMRINLNFHTDVIKAESPVDLLIERLGKWKEALDLSTKIAGTISE